MENLKLSLVEIALKHFDSDETNLDKAIEMVQDILKHLEENNLLDSRELAFLKIGEKTRGMRIAVVGLELTIH